MPKKEKIKIGDIVYLLNEKKMLITPCRVEEEIQRKTTSGVVVSYVVSIGEKQHTLANTDMIFTTPANLKQYMLKRASETVDKMVKRAVTYAKSNYNVMTIPPSSTKDVLEQPKDTIQTYAKEPYTVLEDGTHVRLGDSVKSALSQ